MESVRFGPLPQQRENPSVHEFATLHELVDSFVANAAAPNWWKHIKRLTIDERIGTRWMTGGPEWRQPFFDALASTGMQVAELVTNFRLNRTAEPEIAQPASICLLVLPHVLQAVGADLRAVRLPRRVLELFPTIGAPIDLILALPKLDTIALTECLSDADVADNDVKHTRQRIQLSGMVSFLDRVYFVGGTSLRVLFCEAPAHRCVFGDHVDRTIGREAFMSLRRIERSKSYLDVSAIRSLLEMWTGGAEDGLID